MLACAVEVVVGMKQLVLEAFFVLHELDVVDQKDVTFSIVTFERNGGIPPQGLDEVIEEGFGCDIEHPVSGIVLEDVITNRVQEVRLAQA